MIVRRPQRRLHSPPLKPRRRRTAVALAVAPIAVATLIGVGLYAWESFNSFVYTQSFQSWLGSVMDYCVVAVIGLWPFHALARWRRWTSPAIYLAGGLGLGICVYGVFLAYGITALSAYGVDPLLGQYGADSLLWQFIVTTAPKVIPPYVLMAGAFWLIRHPDRDPEPGQHLIFE
ncbi:MAG: hypothetical protein ABUL73_03550 [Alphaproteobacteria bacterium]